MLVSLLKRLGPKEEMSWETALGVFWLPRIGILVLSVGIVFLLTLAIHRWGQAWLPYLRLAAGYGIAAALIFLAWFLEARSRNYARVLLSGGIAASYLVTFATYYVPFTRVFSSPTPTLLLLAVVVVAWAALAQVRRSILLACAVTGLGHATVALSTVTLDTPSPLGIAGLLVLSAGSAFFLAANRWYFVGALGLVCSYLNHFLFMGHSPRTDTFAAFVLGMTVLAGYWFLFACAEYLAPESLRRRQVSTRFRTLYASANTGAFLFLALVTMSNFEFSRDKTYWLFFVSGAVLVCMAWAYRLRRAEDPLSNAYLVKGLSLLTLGMAARFDGATLTFSLAVESLVLLYGARRGHRTVTRIFAAGAGALAIAHGLYTISATTAHTYETPGYTGAAISALLTLAALFFFVWRHGTHRLGRTRPAMPGPAARSARAALDIQPGQRRAAEL